MIWQDIVIAVVVLMFTATTVPLIRSGTSVPRLTSVPMVLGSVALVIVYATLGLWLSLVIELLATLGWLIIARRSFHA